MPTYTVPVPHSRGFKNGCNPSIQQNTKATKVVDMFMHTLFGRFSGNDQTTYEMATYYDQDQEYIELCIPDEYLSAIQNINKGEKLQAYLAWLVGTASTATDIVFGTDEDADEYEAGTIYFNSVSGSIYEKSATGGWIHRIYGAPQPSSLTFEYDGDGNISGATYENGRVITMTRDGNGDIEVINDNTKGSNMILRDGDGNIVGITFTPVG